MNLAVHTLATLPPPIAGVARYGVLGSPVAHSLSPPMQEAGFRSLEIPAEYLRVEIPPKELNQAIPHLLSAGFLGWNCTLPHKKEMFRLLETLDASAQEAKSVNTVRLEKGRLIGSSTDGAGWEAAFSEVWPEPHRNFRVLLLGCGGVGHAVAARLATVGCRSLTLINRDLSKANLVAAELQTHAQNRFPIQSKAWTLENISSALSESDLLIQATSVGLNASDECPIPPEALRPSLGVYDTIYRKDLTPLIRSAREAGCRAADGLGMLLHQGALSFEIWTGKKSPLQAMRHALESAAGRRI